MVHAIAGSLAGVTTARHPVTAAAVALTLLAATWVAVRVAHGARLLGAPGYEGLT
jgi:hypothetical protein